MPVENETQGQEGEVNPQGTGEVQEQGLNDQPDSGQENDLSLANGFLSRVDEADRPYVEKYIKQWDAGVTRRFQDLHSQYKPYEELGADPETLAQAHQLYRFLSENPQKVYEILHQQFGEQGQNDAPKEEVAGSEFQAIPPELQQRLDQQQAMLASVANYLTTQQEQDRIAEEDAQFEEYLGLLKQEFGDFDEDYVLTKISLGWDGAEAVQAWQNTMQEYLRSVQEQQFSAPPVLSGNGGVPAEYQNVAQASSKDVRKLVADLMAQTAQNEG